MIKKPEEIAMINEGGKKLSEILDQLVAQAKPGVKTIELDQLAEKLIIEAGGVPAFKNYRDRLSEPPFPSTICASVNNQLVHTPAGKYALKSGDILSIDIGMKYPASGRGYFTDMAVTIPIGEISPEAKKLIDVTRESFYAGLEKVKAGNHLSEVSRSIQNYIEKNGFSVVRQLVGHGVGYEVHEEPRVPNYVDPRQSDLVLEAGMVLAIEPMVNVGSYEIDTLDDGWTIVTADGKLCAHYEHTIVVTKDGAKILTKK
ncbi:MAG: type I methionyl aminopeptidase [Candidatus Buchananbacteria bacterium]|nr:type I methionyl aminopeptidase [Candidatus Buchananbacteria bacterium]